MDNLRLVVVDFHLSQVNLVFYSILKVDVSLNAFCAHLFISVEPLLNVLLGVVEGVVLLNVTERFVTDGAWLETMCLDKNIVLCVFLQKSFSAHCF